MLKASKKKYSNQGKNGDIDLNKQELVIIDNLRLSLDQATMLHESRPSGTEVYSIRSPAGTMWITLPAASQYSQYE